MPSPSIAKLGCTWSASPFGAILYLYFDPDPYDGIPGEYSWCRVNDRGPDPATGRSLDISLAVAEDLGLEWYGVGLVEIYRVE